MPIRTILPYFERLLPSISVVLLTCLFSGGATDLLAQGGSDRSEADKKQQSKSAPHELFAKRIGRWTMTTEMSPAFGASSVDTEVAMRVILDGKFLISKGKMMSIGETKDTFTIFGYDSLTGEYMMLPLNSAYTSSAPLIGKKRDDGIIEYKGTMKDAYSPEGREYRAEEENVSDDEFIIRVYDESGTEDEFLVFTLTFKKKTEGAE